jgi:hypothetical protein
MVTRDVLMGIGIGAVLAYVADPQGGRRRRARARDQIVHAGRKTRDAMGATARDLANRTTGMVAETRGLLTDDAVDDRRLIERVRAQLGRASSHPRAIDVEAANGTVTLRGPILTRELDNLLAAVGSVRGVKAVVNELEPHESAEGVPSLQGEGRIASNALDILQRNWAPATQALVTAGFAATGVCLAAYARRSAN